jgi:hypothetical protein
VHCATVRPDQSVVSSRSTAAHRGCSISRAANAYYQCTALIVLLTLIFCCCWKRPEVFSRVFFRPTSDLTKYIQKKPKSSEISHFIRKSMNLELLFVWKIIVSSNNHNNISVLPCFANNIHQWKSKASQDLSAKLLSLLYLWSQKKSRDWFFFVKTLCERKNSFLYQKWTLCWHQLNMSRRHIVNRKLKFFFNYTIIKQMIVKVRNFLVDDWRQATSRNQFCQLIKFHEAWSTSDIVRLALELR